MNPFVLAGIVIAFFLGAFVLLAIAARDKRKQDEEDERNYQEDRHRVLQEIQAKKRQEQREMEQVIARNKVIKSKISLEKQSVRPTQPFKPEPTQKSTTKKVDDDDNYSGRNSFTQQSSLNSFNRVDDTPTQHHCAPEPTRSHSNSYSCPSPDTSSSHSSDSSSSSDSGGGGD